MDAGEGGKGPGEDVGGPAAETRARMASRRRRRLWAPLGVVALLVVALLIGNAEGPDPPSDSVASGVEREAAEASELTPAQIAIEVGDRARREAEVVTEALEAGPLVTEGTADLPRVALTFDDGPGPATEEVLRILAEHEAKATFFNLGVAMEEMPGTSLETLLQGHTVAAHTHGHERLPGLSPSDLAAELARQGRVFEGEGLPPPRLIRPPYGDVDLPTLERLADRGYLAVLWNVDTGDYAAPGARAIVERALEGATPGAIILLHDGGGDRGETVAALPHILRGLERRGLEPVTLIDLLAGGEPEDPEAPPPPAGQGAAASPAPTPAFLAARAPAPGPPR